MMDPAPLGNRGKSGDKPVKGSAANKPAPAPSVSNPPMITEIENDDDHGDDLPYDNPANPPGVELPEIPPQNPLPEIPPQQPAPKRNPWAGDAHPELGRALKERDSLTSVLRALVGACADADEQNKEAKVKLTRVKAHADAQELLKILDERAEADKKKAPPK